MPIKYKNDTVDNPLTPMSVAGISERMILIPGLIDFSFYSFKDSLQLLKNVAERRHGAVIIAPYSCWEQEVKFPIRSGEVNDIVGKMHNKDTVQLFFQTGMYDGIDLPGDACRLLIMDGDTITRMITQRIKQGLSRGARGSSDYCTDILLGKDLTSWISLEINLSYFTSATKVRIEIGKNVSK